MGSVRAAMIFIRPAQAGHSVTSERDGVALTRLLQYGADPEIAIKGNGERGSSVLQEALCPGREGKREVAQVLIE